MRGGQGMVRAGGPHDDVDEGLVYSRDMGRGNSREGGGAR